MTIAIKAAMFADARKKKARKAEEKRRNRAAAGVPVCRICGKELTNPFSIHAGTGPECEKEYGI